MQSRIAKIAAIVAIVIATVWYVHWMLQPSYQPPDTAESLKKVEKRIAQVRGGSGYAGSAERMQREDAALAYLKSRAAKNQTLPTLDEPRRSVFMPGGVWPGAGDRNTSLGLAELYETYYHADGPTPKVVICTATTGELLAQEKDDGDMELVDKFGQPLP